MAQLQVTTWFARFLLFAGRPRVGWMAGENNNNKQSSNTQTKQTSKQHMKNHFFLLGVAGTASCAGWNGRNPIGVSHLQVQGLVSEGAYLQGRANPKETYHH